MRKNLLLYTGSVTALITLLFSVMLIDRGDDALRVHQHLNRPNENALDACLTADEDALCTHLPLIVIDTMGQDVPGRPLGFGEFNPSSDLHFIFETTEDGGTEINANVKIIDNTDQWNHDNDTPMFESLASMRIRGRSSRFFDKPSYRIRLIDDHENNNRLPLLGMAASHEWVLHGPFLDKTLMRNYVWMNIASEVMRNQFVPDVRFCELMVNGENQGLYVLMETPRVEANRINLNRFRPGMPETSYFFRIDWTQHPERKINTFSNFTLRLEYDSHVEILYPSQINQSEPVVRYITSSINTFERYLYSVDLLRQPERLEQFIDIDSFVDFYLMNEFVGNNDLFLFSTYFHKDIRGRLVAGPVWDFNNVLDNFFTNLPYDEFYLHGRGWLNRLFLSPVFAEKVIERWGVLRETTLSEERLLGYMADVETWLGSAIDRNFEIWGYSFDYRNLSTMARRSLASGERAQGLTLADVNPSSYEEAMDQMRAFMIIRGRWMDENIDVLRKYSHPSRHALWYQPEWP